MGKSRGILWRLGKTRILIQGGEYSMIIKDYEYSDSKLKELGGNQFKFYGPIAIWLAVI